MFFARRLTVSIFAPRIVFLKYLNEKVDKFICFAVLKAYHPIRHKCFEAIVFHYCFVCTNGSDGYKNRTHKNFGQFYDSQSEA